MKAFTEIQQSKKLAKILPPDSADMCYRIVAYNPNDTHVYQPYCFSGTLESDIPCWSLSALLELIPTAIDEYTDDFSQLELTKQSVSYVYAMGNLRKGFLKDNLLDAVFEIVVWLKENNKI